MDPHKPNRTEKFKSVTAFQLQTFYATSSHILFFGQIEMFVLCWSQVWHYRAKHLGIWNATVHPLEILTGSFMQKGTTITTKYQAESACITDSAALKLQRCFFCFFTVGAVLQYEAYTKTCLQAQKYLGILSFLDHKHVWFVMVLRNPPWFEPVRADRKDASLTCGADTEAYLLQRRNSNPMSVDKWWSMRRGS